MNLRTKTITVVVLTFSLFILLIYVSLNYLLNQQFAILEQKHTQKDIERAAHMLQEKIDSLHSVIEDYAIWDETYDFMEDRNEKYLERNWQDSTFTRFQIETLCLIDLSGDIVAIKQYDLANKQELPVSENISRLIKQNTPLFLNAAATGQNLKGILSSQTGSVIVAFNPVFDNEQKSPMRGVMIALRLLDETILAQNPEYSEMELTIHSLDERGTLNFKQDSQTSGHVRVLSEDHISGEYLFLNLYGRPAFILRSMQERDIHFAGRQSIYCAVSFLLIIGAFFVIIFHFLLERVILRRLYLLINGINQITRTQDLSSALLAPGKDEIAALARTINEMLFALFTEKTLRQQALGEVQELNRSLEQRVTEKAALLHKQLYTDHLTATPNRLQLLEDLKDAKQHFLAIMNIDKFRTINEFYGYQAGDGLLKELADHLAKLIEPYHSQLYRLAGDEYAILAGGTGESVFSSWMLSIHDAIENKPFKIHGHSYYLFVTVGIASTRDKPLEKAQMALKYARQCRMPLQVYHDGLPTKEDYRNNLQWVQEVQDAIQENRIMVYYQPIMDTVSSKISKYEVLARLIDRAGNVVSPGVFLPIIKKTKLYPRLTEVVLKESFTHFLDKNVDFSINLSAADISDNGVQELIMALLQDSQVARRVTFEFVESEEFKDSYDLSFFIQMVKGYGAKIAIDDFGSGYSNFAYILKMGAHYIKIDGSLISEIANNPAVVAIVESIVYFAQQLGIKTIAEYVSSEAIYLAAKQIGFDYVQGYYIGEPKPYLIEEES